MNKLEVTLLLGLRLKKGWQVKTPHGHLSCGNGKGARKRTREWLAKVQWYLYPFGHPSRIQGITLQHVSDNMAIEDMQTMGFGGSSLLYHV